MKLKTVLLSFGLMLPVALIQAQEFGLSFSYFIPRNGYFSTPISPFSIRGLGVDLSKYVSLETGASLYRMSGLNIIDVPFKSKAPMTGPGFTIFVPAELVLQFKGKKTELDLKGGGFAFYSFLQKLNYGNIDRAIRTMEGWNVANADIQLKNNPGFGYHVGFEYTVTVTRSWGISFETNYLMGSSKIPLTGTYTGADANGLHTKPIDEPNAKVDFTGLEFSIGIILSGR
jgi:hypothetical protein